MPYAAFSLAI